MWNPDAIPTPDAQTGQPPRPPPAAGATDPIEGARRDPTRLAAVRATRLLDTPSEPSFDRLTRLAVALLGVPAAFLSLVDEDRDFYKASTGLPEPLRSGRELVGPTFCHHAIAGSGPLVVPDTAADFTYRDIPTIRTLGVAAYLGVPLVVDGKTIGSFCAIDSAPHAWSAAEVDVMVGLAESALREIALRAAQDALEAQNLSLALANGALFQRTRDLELLNERLRHQAVELELRTGELQAANRAKSEFLATMSHELRTPLNAIGGYAEILELGIRGPISEAQRTDLNRIKASQRHLLGLVDEVLDLARVDVGELQVERDRVSAAETVDAALALVRPQAIDRGITMTEACDRHDDHSYIGDEPRVRQVLVNLLANAVKFSTTGGTVTVSCTRSTVPPDGCALALGAPYVAMAVKDDGVGVPRAQLSRIFEPFTQADGGLTRARGGTGLGLAIGRRLARIMGGDITVTSIVGVGSTFTLWLPASADPALARDPGDAGGVSRIGEGLLPETGAIVHEWKERLRTSSQIPHGATLDDVDLEDHGATLVVEIAHALRCMGQPEADSVALLRDGTAILGLIAERHGARRARMRWPSAAVRHEFALLREVVGARVRRVVDDHSLDPRDTATAMAVVARLLDQCTRLSLGGFRVVDSGGAG